MDYTEIVKKSAYQMGFDLVAVSSAQSDDLERERYQSWRDQGHAADLAYMVRENPRRWVPQDLLPEAKSVITFMVNFYSGSKRVEPKLGFGRVARYAWGKDYHIVVKKRLEEWVKTLHEMVGPSLKTKILVDSSPLLERSFARRGGLGFVGKNTLLISRKLGSFIFLSEVLTNLDLRSDELNDPSVWGKDDPFDSAQDHPHLKSKDDCGACKKCLSDCPTGALVAPRQLDARKCISYWTIENRGEIPDWIRPKIGDWIYGCDICQDVCPYIGLSKETKWKEFLPESGTGPYLSLLEVLSLKTDKEFKIRFAETPLLRAKRTGLIRNACVVAVNQNFKQSAPLLQDIARNDSDELIKNYARWACGQLENSRIPDFGI